MAVQWYTVFSKPHKEVQVANYLDANHIEVYTPIVPVNPVNPRASKQRPYFPRYLFVHADLEAVNTSILQWAPGAVGLIEFGGVPAIVPDKFISDLRHRIAEIEVDGGLPGDSLKQGDLVQIKNGPLAGYDAIFDLRLSGTERVQVLLHWLGRQMKVKLNANEIEKRNRG